MHKKYLSIKFYFIFTLLYLKDSARIRVYQLVGKLHIYQGYLVYDVVNQFNMTEITSKCIRCFQDC